MKFDTKFRSRSLYICRSPTRSTRIYPQMFAKTTFILKGGCILYLDTQEMGHNGSRGPPESVAPEFLSWRRTEMKLPPPKSRRKLEARSFPPFMTCSSGLKWRRSHLYDQTDWSLTALNVRNRFRVSSLVICSLGLK